ncbi:hypothetical protein OQJ13_07695 [Legionella sp. PATHC035]|uniref:hypothetical protein n=1 Tax=Legionella sp. PATHC035 TaxID=2992040 RepID=UPI002244177D|nr:hypothetical protein [Legionella sp. PATHC035]MCW8408853.1 hypothetical protein [Legionella sp. PATHC035]
MFSQVEKETHRPPPRKLFIRTDNLTSISPKHFEKYNVNPATHLNLLPHDRSGYVDSGYLSTFEYSKGMGLESVLAYGGTYIHFIFLHSEIAEIIHLTGGTNGLTHDGEETGIKVIEGTVWDVPYFQHEIPQIFYTHRVEVELGPLNFRTDTEVLLGGNWHDYAEIISIKPKLAKTIFKKNVKSEEEVYQLLLELASPYTLAKVGLEQQWNSALEKACLLNWWNQLSLTKKDELITLYELLHQQHKYPEPNDFVLMKELHQLHSVNHQLKQKYPEITNYFKLIGSALDKFHMLCQIDPMNDDSRQRLIQIGLRDFFADKCELLLTPNAVHQLCIDLKTYIDYLILEADFRQLIREINFLKLSSEELEAHFPKLAGIEVVLDSHCKKPMGNVSEFIDNYIKNMAEIKEYLPEIKDRLKAFNYRKHYCDNLSVYHFCHRIQESHLPTAVLSEWLLGLYEKLKDTFKANDDHKKMIRNGLLLDALFDNLKKLHDSLVQFHCQGEISKSLKQRVMNKMQGIIEHSLACSSKAQELDRDVDAQLMLNAIKNLSNQVASLVMEQSKITFFPRSALVFNEPSYVRKESELYQNDSQHLEDQPQPRRQKLNG